MIWNLFHGEERLLLWKKLRDDIKESETEEQLKVVATFFFKVPFGARTIDYYSPGNWPSPWEILFYGSFCTSSISLLIFYTLVLVNVENIELHLVEDSDGTYLLPVINNRFVLNYELGTVNNYSEIKDNFKTLKIYLNEDIKNIK